MKHFFILILFFFLATSLFAQDKIRPQESLDTVYLSHYFKPEIVEMTDLSPLLQKDLFKMQISPAFKELLDHHTSIFFKEYGRGMLSSISIRGTGASHTLVLWNGIPVNSKLNGQVDFNSLYFTGNDYIKLKKGGQSVLFGNGAIGGVIETGQSVRFKNSLKFTNSFHYGSFSSLYNETSLDYSNPKTAFKLNFTTNDSQNDYVYPGTGKRNNNGEYKGRDFNMVLARRFPSKNILSLHSHFNNLDRNLSGTLYSPSQSKLYTVNSQNVFSWTKTGKNWENFFKTGMVYEKYEYYPDKDNNHLSTSQSVTYTGKNETHLKRNKGAVIIGNIYQYTKAEGDHIQKHDLQSYAIYSNLLFNISSFKINTGLRKEFHSLYDIPLLGRFKFLYKNKDGRLSTGFSLSKNFKVPDINDLYWVPGGNPGLKPEESYTLENFVRLKKASGEIKLTAFYIHSKNLIKWVPYTSDLWKPVNFEEVISKGIELEYSRKAVINRQWNLFFTASFTLQDVEDQSTGKKIPFVPSQMAYLAVNIKHHNWEMLISDKYTGKVYTTRSNTLYLEPYQIINLKGLYKKDKWEAGLGINNVFNVYYETFPSRPQPGRNYYINFKIKIDKS